MLSRLAAPPAEVAPQLLGAVLTVDEVSVRLTEVEAYDGPHDAASHAYRGLTKRNAAMFGPPGALYTYLSRGIHTCLNLVCRPAGEGAGILLRGGEVVAGVEIARRRRGEAVETDRLARGPGCLGKALDITLADGGRMIGDDPGLSLAWPDEPVEYARGPRVGVTKEPDRKWRFWIPGEPSVSVYRRSRLAPPPPVG